MLKLSITILAFALIGGVVGQPIGGGPTVRVLQQTFDVKKMLFINSLVFSMWMT
jgi:hypothetical protein